MIEAYLNEMKANGLSPHTVQSFRLVLSNVNSFKPLDKITKQDLIQFFKEFKSTDDTRKLYQVKIKKFFNDIGKPELVEWIKIIKPKGKLRADDVLTSDDINNMLEATDGAYWKAIITFLYESGCRINEARSLKVKDFKETTEGLIIDIPTTKTQSGFRRVILILSTQYIRNLKALTNKSNDEYLFHTTVVDINRNLKKIAKKAGIEKPVHAHSFRHATASSMVRDGYNESIIRQKLGWSKTSTMIDRYIHLNNDAVVEATLQHNGKTQPAKPITEVKQADKISIVDAAMQFSKLSEENQALKDRMEKRDAEMEEIKKQLDLVLKAYTTRTG